MIHRDYVWILKISFLRNVHLEGIWIPLPSPPNLLHLCQIIDIYSCTIKNVRGEISKWLIAWLKIAQERF